MDETSCRARRVGVGIGLLLVVAPALGFARDEGASPGSGRPVTIEGVGDAGALFAGPRRQACARAGERVVCWRGEARGRLDERGAALPPAPLEGLPGPVEFLGSSSGHSCALSDGGVWCWGSNRNGELGVDVGGESPVPVLVSDVIGASALAVGDGHNCATRAGAVWCWGQGPGTGRSAMAQQPVLVKGLDGPVRALVAGDAHTCALTPRGVQCWGNNHDGQLGNGRPEPVRTQQAFVAVSDWDTLTPVSVTGLGRGVTALSAGDDATCALTDGGVFCWGQLTSEASSLVPTRVPLMGLASSIAVGDDHACAIVDGRVWCWGTNDYGMLGNGIEQPSTVVPVEVTGLGGRVDELVVGNGFSCARLGGTVKCWGADYVAPDRDVELIILGGGKTRAEADKALSAWTKKAKALKGKLELGPSYPMVVRSDRFEGLNAGFDVVLLGACPPGEATDALTIVKSIDKRAYTRVVKAQPRAHECPSPPVERPEWPD